MEGQCKANQHISLQQLTIQGHLVLFLGCHGGDDFREQFGSLVPCRVVAETLVDLLCGKLVLLLDNVSQRFGIVASVPSQMTHNKASVIPAMD